ncbi:MAG TPA: energy-coupling factor transporter transmembrane component T [Verrucomicrobiae bacterium]|nr:energy-coupling factor transporter transmembrane component T [Verrucomicrobiae bacterium]
MSARLLTHHHGIPRSPIHRAPVGWKLLAGLAVITTTVLVPPHWTGWYATAGTLLVLAIAISRLPLLFLLKRLLLLSPFVLGVALVNAWEPTGRMRWEILALRSVICLVTVILIANTTPFSRTLQVLRTVRVPELLVTTIALMHRYLFVLAEEAERMRRARSSRTFTASRRFQWKTLSTVLGQLFIRASERAERIYDAMCARGWK